MIPMRQVNDEVLYTGARITTVGRDEIEFLKQRAGLNRRKRIRLCAHADVTDAVHEMLIVHGREAYVRPHKHVNKSESYHLIEGEAAILTYADDGAASDTIRLSEHPALGAVFCRISGNVYHTLVFLSEYVVFHETTNGPFKREETLYAPWAPSEEDRGGVAEFLERAHRQFSVLTASQGGRITRA